MTKVAAAVKVKATARSLGCHTAPTGFVPRHQLTETVTFHVTHQLYTGRADVGLFTSSSVTKQRAESANTTCANMCLQTIVGINICRHAHSAGGCARSLPIFCQGAESGPPHTLVAPPASCALLREHARLQHQVGILFNSYILNLIYLCPCRGAASDSSWSIPCLPVRWMSICLRMWWWPGGGSVHFSCAFIAAVPLLHSSMSPTYKLTGRAQHTLTKAESVPAVARLAGRPLLVGAHAVAACDAGAQGGGEHETWL
jgi:hypothetical protein